MRFQVDLNEKDRAILASLRQDFGMRSNTELFSQLLAMASWAVRQRRQGRKVASLENEKAVCEFVSPLLERVAPEHELPRVQVDWTPEQLSSLAALASSEAPEPTRDLARAMKR